ncbi:MAG: serine hydrolase [Chitinophagales bacterium]
MKNLIILCLLISFIQLAKAQVDMTLAIQLKNVIENSVSNLENHGVSAHLMMPNGTVWNGTAGVGKNNLPITDTTVFHGASTTKLNIATLVMLLAEENLIDLDESWNTYASLDVEFDTLITVRQLLNHTSGIADYLETASSGNDITSDFDYFFTPQHILENIVSDVPSFSAGTSFQYSNSNYALAALIVETVTGNPVQTELRNRIWTPLEMNHTYFGAYETFTEPSAGVWWNFGNGLKSYNNVSTTSMLSYAYGAGNIISCPTDLALLLSALLNGELVNAESLDEMLAFVPNSFSSWTAGYGLGIHHASGQNNDMVIGHDGYFSNLTSMFHSMEHGFTLVTMTNTQTQWFGIFNPMYDILSDYFMATAINEPNYNTELRIYPNPSNGQFYITSQQNIDEIEIKNVVGKTIYHALSQSKNISLTLKTEGLYFVTATLGSQTITNKLIIK